MSEINENPTAIAYKMMCGKAEDKLPKIPSGSIDLTVTSPPYSDIRNYEGFEFDFPVIAEELYRVTKQGGVLAWIVSDKYQNYSDSLNSFSQALKFRELGFSVRTIILKKNQVAPFNHKTQVFYPVNHEYLFICSKGRPKTFNPLRDRLNRYAGKFEPTLSKKRDAYGVSAQHERNWTVPEMSLRTSVWEINVGRHHSTKDVEAFEHPAIFPEKLAEDIILTWSQKGDLVADFFSGSGTTGKMAVVNNRNFIGGDVSIKYCGIGQRRIEDTFDLFVKAKAA